jgi:hypothetical protein
MELLLALALAWVAVAPDPVTLAVTRGAAGAVRGASRPLSDSGRTSSDSGRTSSSSSAGEKAQTGRMRAAVAGAGIGVRAARVRRAEGRDLATLSVRVARATGRAGRSVASAARTRWAPGDTDREGAAGRVVVGQVVDDTTSTDHVVDHDPEVDHDLQDEVQDVEPTATQSRRWDKQPETEVDKRSFDVRAAGYDGWVDSQGYPTDHAGWFPSDPSSTNDLEMDMSIGSGMQVTELESLNEVRAEVEAATVMTEALTEAVQAAQDWASGLADRWSGTDWGTRQLDAGVVAVAESAATLIDGEAMAEALAVINAAVIEAQSLSEVLASAGAHGNVDRFHAA